MNSIEAALWEKIKLFQFNEPGIDFSFEERLARENGWTKEYTRCVIDEYKRFIFLCCTSETGITPSDPVDQAWHLHLTFTRSYWIDLCKNTLAKEVHHNPTKGGQKEAEKFNDYYTSYLNCINKNLIPIRRQISGTTIKKDFRISIFNG